MGFHDEKDTMTIILMFWIEFPWVIFLCKYSMHINTTVSMICSMYYVQVLNGQKTNKSNHNILFNSRGSIRCISIYLSQLVSPYRLLEYVMIIPSFSIVWADKGVRLHFRSSSSKEEKSDYGGLRLLLSKVSCVCRSLSRGIFGHVRPLCWRFVLHSIVGIFTA